MEHKKTFKYNICKKIKQKETIYVYIFLFHNKYTKLT